MMMPTSKPALTGVPLGLLQDSSVFLCLVCNSCSPVSEKCSIIYRNEIVEMVMVHQCPVKVIFLPAH